MDLVQAQIRVAEGMTLPELGLQQENIKPEVIYFLSFVARAGHLNLMVRKIPIFLIFQYDQIRSLSNFQAPILYS